MKLKKILNISYLYLLLVAFGFAIGFADDFGNQNYGTTGISDTSKVQNILQVTLNLEMDKQARYGPNPWRHDGQRFVYVTARGGSYWDYGEIATLKYDGTGFVRLTNNSVMDTAPAYTPDGNSVVFVRRDGTSGNHEIVKKNADGTGTETNLTQAHGAPYAESDVAALALAVSPNGTHIAYAGEDPLTNDRRLYAMDIDGSNAKNLSGSLYFSGSGGFTWSRDSQWIFFVASSTTSGVSGSKIYKVKADATGVPVMLSADIHQVSEYWPAISPDGKKLAYQISDSRTSLPNNIYMLAIMNPDGSNKQVIVQVISDGSGWDYIESEFSWSPNSRWIAFTQNEAGTNNNGIFIVDTETQMQYQLTEGYSDVYPWWSPDGKRILFDDASYSYSGNTRDGNTNGEDFLVMNLIGDYGEEFPWEIFIPAIIKKKP